MDLKRLRTFVTVAEHGTVLEASRLLGVTQPALSRQLMELNGELGLDLFRRAGRRLALTAEGEQMLEHCRAVLGHADLLDERIASFRQGEAGLLRIAAAPQTIEHVLPTLLHRYAGRHPGVKVKVIEAVAFDHFDLVVRGDVELAINVAQAGDDRFASFALPPLEVLAVFSRSPASHEHRPAARHARRSSAPLARPTLDIGTLAQRPLLLPKPGFVSRKLFDAACRLARIEPIVVLESDAPAALIALARAGHGTAVIPSTVRVADRRLAVARLAYGGRPLQTPRAVLWDRRRSLPAYAEAFCAMLAAHMRELFALARR
jgi:DNA-binding transcriptional LysR family regulator